MAGENRRKGAAIEKAKKGAISDARKRALRLYGDALGNCIYDKQYERASFAMRSPVHPVSSIPTDQLRTAPIQASSSTIPVRHIREPPRTSPYSHPPQHAHGQTGPSYPHPTTTVTRAQEQHCPPPHPQQPVNTRQQFLNHPSASATHHQHGIQASSLAHPQRPLNQLTTAPHQHAPLSSNLYRSPHTPNGNRQPLQPVTQSDSPDSSNNSHAIGSALQAQRTTVPAPNTGQVVGLRHPTYEQLALEPQVRPNLEMKSTIPPQLHNELDDAALAALDEQGMGITSCESP